MLLFGLFLKNRPRGIWVVVDSHVSVLTDFFWHSLTRPVDVRFLLGNNPPASVPDLQYSTEELQKEADSGDVDRSVLRAANQTP